MRTTMRIAILLAAAATAVTVTLAPGPAAAQSLPADLLACRDIVAADERLVCYDRAVDRRVDHTGDAPGSTAGEPGASVPPAATSPASAQAAAPASAPPASVADRRSETAPLPTPEELFGRDSTEIQRRVDQATGREELQKITGVVVELIEIAPDRIAVKLDNGQIWRQTVPDRFFLREGHEVEIRRATLGSYLMNRAGSSRSIRVERAD